MANDSLADFFMPDARLYKVVARHWLFIVTFMVIGFFLGFIQKDLSTTYHARAIIDVGYTIGKQTEFIHAEPLADIEEKIHKDLEKSGMQNIRTFLLENKEYRKFTITAIAELRNTEEQKKFVSVIDRHIKRLATLEKKSRHKLVRRTTRLKTPSGDIICTAGCKMSFSGLYGIFAALVALIACILFDRLTKHRHSCGAFI